MHRMLISAAIIAGICVANPALANWWIVRSSDEKCLVVDIEPTGKEVDIEPTGKEKGITKVGKDVYQTAEQAEADIKRLCKESKAEDQPTRDPGKAE